MAGPTFSNMFNPSNGYYRKATEAAEKFATRYGNQITDAYDSHVARGITKRQDIIKQNSVNHKLEHEAWAAERADGMPRDWGTAFKDAGGGGGAAWRVGANAVGGAVIGGGLDASMGNDSWSDGAMGGALAGALVGAGSFANSVNKLKVGKYTPTVNGGVTEASRNINPNAVQPRPSEDVVTEMGKRSGSIKPNFTTVGKPY